ncbi:hypothetical protein GW17_00040572 [Ensete ventricosum]|nr:hypothetical protein GW17_00040572 [Ensete ventricosum]
MAVTLAAGAAYACKHQPCRVCWRLPLQGALVMVGRPLVGGLGRSRLPLAAGLALGGRPCMGAGCGWRPLLFAAKTALKTLVSDRVIMPEDELKGSDRPLLEPLERQSFARGGGTEEEEGAEVKPEVANEGEEAIPT